MAAGLHPEMLMLKLAHLEPINQSSSLSQPELLFLADAFSEFISASAKLESSYGQLQLEVASLSQELAERNSALKASLAENERVHSALQQIVDSMPCGVLVVDGSGGVSMINPEGRQLLQLGTGVADCLREISIQSGIDLEGFLGRNNRLEDEQEFCRNTVNGKRWLSVHDRRLFEEEQGNAEGTAPYGFGCRQTILILRDVTLHKQAELERERARKATALSEVAMTLAHEIRNPLASLELFAGLIASGGDDVSEWVSHLHAGIRLLAGTVNNVLSFHGVGFPAFSALDLCETMRSCVEFVRPIADEAGIALVFRTEAEEVFIRGNSSALQQLVLNIVCNSIRHTRAGGAVSVTVRMARGRKLQSGHAVLEFADSGSGIALEHLEEIFRAGFSGSGNSSGLGLAVCKQIVQQHDGEIKVTSELGKGTTFYVEIPTV